MVVAFDFITLTMVIILITLIKVVVVANYSPIKGYGASQNIANVPPPRS